MDSRPVPEDDRPISAKVLVTGGFGVGKTTFVGAISEIPPLRTEEAMTDKSEGVDDRSFVQHKTTTTVAMDFGKLHVEDDLVLYLFGTPGQERFGFMWDDLALGSLGAVVLVDTRRLDDCFHAIDYCESRDLPFVVALNQFERAPVHPRDEVRVALDIDPTVPLLECDARDEDSVRMVLVSLLEHVLSHLDAMAPPPPPPPPSNRVDPRFAEVAARALEHERAGG